MGNKGILTAVILALLAPAAAFSASPTTTRTVDQIALVVDQTAMTRGELEDSIATVFASQHMKTPAPGSSDYGKVKKEVVEAFIREVLLAEEADREKIQISDGELQHNVDTELENMKQQFSGEQEFEDELKKEGVTQDDLKSEIQEKLLRRLKANRVLQAKQRELPDTVFVTDDEVRNYFRVHPKDYERIKFSIILFHLKPGVRKAYVAEVEKQARELLAKLKAGADFAAAAKKYSEDQGTASKGGEVGSVYRTDLDPELAKGIFAIPAKGMGIVRTPDGVYIVKVESKGAADYDAVASGIKEHLLKQKQENAFNAWLAGLEKNAYIVEDGKVVAYQPPAAPATASSAGASAAASAVSGPNGAAAAESQASNGSQATASSAPSASGPGRNLYPTLPDPGSLTLNLGWGGFSFGSKDLAAYYDPSVNTDQGFPFGMDFDAGLDYALSPTLQLGLKLDGMVKFAQTVKFSDRTDSWSASAAGPALDAKILIPLDESTNFFLTAGGGYYFLLGGGVSISGAAVTENADFNASSFGGEAGAGIEFFFDSDKNSALDLQVGYRYLKFQPVTPKLTVNDGGPVPDYPSPLVNSDGSQAWIDFSGIKAGLSLRFYLGKGD